MLGSEAGTLYIYDPTLFDEGTVTKFNNIDGVRKRKKVIMVKWFEAFNEGANPNKFIVVFEDGTLYVFFKDSQMNSSTAPKTVRVPVATKGEPAGENGKSGEGMQINPANVEFKEYSRD